MYYNIRIQGKTLDTEVNRTDPLHLQEGVDYTVRVSEFSLSNHNLPIALLTKGKYSVHVENAGTTIVFEQPVTHPEQILSKVNSALRNAYCQCDTVHDMPRMMYNPHTQLFTLDSPLTISFSKDLYRTFFRSMYAKAVKDDLYVILGTSTTGNVAHCFDPLSIVIEAHLHQDSNKGAPGDTAIICERGLQFRHFGDERVPIAFTVSDNERLVPGSTIDVKVKVYWRDVRGVLHKVPFSKDTLLKMQLKFERL